MTARITLIGGPTALVEFGGLRLLTDPTFDGPGDYQLPHVTLTKTSRPAIAAADVGPVDAVLLSHDQHADNLDNSGRDFLRKAPRVLTTTVGAKRLGGNAEGLAPWQSVNLSKDGKSVQVTAAPAHHGPAGIEPLAGDVIGFVLTSNDPAVAPVYITGGYRLVRRRCRGGAPVQGRYRAAVRRLGADARTVSPDHGYERRHRNRSRISRCNDRACSPRRLGAFQAERR